MSFDKNGRRTQNLKPVADCDCKKIDWFAFWLLIIFTVALDAFVGLFAYKVWNERQMTHEYHRQADALERVATAEEVLVTRAPQLGVP